METLNALKNATNEWILFDQQKRFAQNSHRKPLDWDTLIRTLQEKKNLYAGIRLHHNLKILCVDIDARETPLTESQAREYIRIFEELLGATCIPEFSKNNGLHLFFKYEGKLPESGRSKGIPKEVLDIPHTVEWYWHNQAILISNKNLAPWRNWETITPTQAQTITQILPDTPTKTNTQTNTKTKTKKTKTKNITKTYTKRKNAWFELLPLLPELHTPIYADRIVKEDNEKIYLRRPNKHQHHSAVLFKQTGVFYNFSTNWEEVGIQEAIPTESFLIRYTQKTPREIGKILHQYIHQLFTQNNIPIPRRKHRNYYIIKRKQLREFIIIDLLLNKKTRTTTQIIQHLNQTLRFKTHPATVHKDLETLIQKQIITKTKNILQKENHYTLQTNPITAILYDAILTQNYTPGTKLLLYTAFFNLAIPHILTSKQPTETIYQILNQFKQHYAQYILNQNLKLNQKIKIQPQYHTLSIQYQKRHKPHQPIQQYQQLNQNQKERFDRNLHYFVQPRFALQPQSAPRNATLSKRAHARNFLAPPSISFKQRIAKNKGFLFFPREAQRYESYKRLLWWWWKLGSSP